MEKGDQTDFQQQGFKSRQNQKFGRDHRAQSSLQRRSRPHVDGVLGAECKGRP